MAYILTLPDDEAERPEEIGGVREPRRPKPSPRSGGAAVSVEPEPVTVEAQGLRLTI